MIIDNPVFGALIVANGVRVVGNMIKESKEAREALYVKDYTHEIHFDFNKRYVKNEVGVTEYLGKLHVTSPLIVPCAGIRYVDTLPEISMELIDYNGTKMTIPISRILTAIANNQIMVVNAQVYQYGLILQE